jgi:histidine triad (HIT) family protein
VSECIFCKIVEGKIPAKKVFEDEDMLAFNDISPIRPVHVLVIPKKHITSLATATPEDALVLGKMLVKANEIAVSQAGLIRLARCLNASRRQPWAVFLFGTG